MPKSAHQARWNRDPPETQGLPVSAMHDAIHRAILSGSPAARRMITNRSSVGSISFSAFHETLRPRNCCVKPDAKIVLVDRRSATRIAASHRSWLSGALLRRDRGPFQIISGHPQEAARLARPGLNDGIDLAEAAVEGGRDGIRARRNWHSTSRVGISVHSRGLPLIGRGDADSQFRWRCDAVADEAGIANSVHRAVGGCA